MMNKITQKLRAEAKKLIDGKRIKYIIGYQKGSDSFHSTPCFIDSVEEVNKLIWSPTCFYNLAVYILDEKKKVLKKGEVPDTRPIGIVAKGCDSRAIIELISEHIISREEVIILGIPCSGVVDPKKISEVWRKKALPNETALQMEITEHGILFVGETKEGKVSFAREEVISENCKGCKYNNPLIYDVLLGEKIEKPVGDEYTGVKEIESVSLGKRWKFWAEKFERCIRCYACRSVCPLCYCEECVIDPTSLAVGIDTTPQDKAHRVKWIERSTALSETIFFHLTRVFHIAGRCVGCGECERACPVNIPLRKLTKKLEKDVKKMFGYEAGVKPDEKPLLATFELDDPEAFIR